MFYERLIYICYIIQIICNCNKNSAKAMALLVLLEHSPNRSLTLKRRSSIVRLFLLAQRTVNLICYVTTLTHCCMATSLLSARIM